MAIAQAHSPATSFGSTSATSVSAAITQPTAGNLLVAAFSGFGGTVTNHTVSDTANSTWGNVRLLTQNTSAHRTSMHYQKNCLTASPTTVTLNGGASTGGLQGWVLELSGVDTTTPNVAGESAAATGTSTAPATTSKTNSNANSAYVVFMGNDDSSATSTITEPAGYTSVGVQKDGNTLEAASMDFLVVASSAARTATWTTSSFNWSALVAIFQQASAGAAVQQRLMLTGVGT